MAQGLGRLGVRGGGGGGAAYIFSFAQEWIFSNYYCLEAPKFVATINAFIVGKPCGYN